MRNVGVVVVAAGGALEDDAERRGGQGEIGRDESIDD